MRTVIFTADDFGLDQRVNAAIVKAHTEGVLTAAGLMVNEPAANEAVNIAKQNPKLCVGLHVAASFGTAALTHQKAPAIVRSDGRFRDDPAMAGMACFFRTDARRQVHDEILTQFDRFCETGLPTVQVDGHQHLHLHPVLWRITATEAVSRGFRWVRIPNEEWHPLPDSPPTTRLEWLFFRVLGRRARKDAARRGLLVADRVYGHFATNRLGPDVLLATLARLTGAVNEVYLHPGAPGRTRDVELEGLLDSRAKNAIEEHSLRIANFAQLVSERGTEVQT